MNNELIDLYSCAFRMALANRDATDSTFILGEVCFKGMVSQTTNSVKADASIFSYALPDKTGCVIKARTLLAPFSI